MNIEKITRKSHYFNEDRYLITNDFIMVMDGATSLLKSSLTPTGGCYLVKNIKSLLPKTKGTIIERLNTISNQLYLQLAEKNETLENQLPSAGLAWVEFDYDNVIIHTIGDCEVTIKEKNNKIHRIIIDDLLKLDDISLQEMIKISKENNITIKETRPLINNTLIKHRLLMNKENGYAVFAPYPNYDFKYSTVVFKKELISEIYLYSDGFADAFTTFNLYKSHEDMFKNSLNINEVVNNIVKEAFDDPTYDKYPRFKKIDDITVVKITF